MSLYGLGEKKKKGLSLSKLACVMGFCLEGLEPADKRHAGRYICLLLLYNPNSVTQRVCIISISVSNIYCTNFSHRAPFRDKLSSGAISLSKLAGIGYS